MNDQDMALAAERVAALGGGLVAVRDGEVLAELALPIAGLMSDLPLPVVRDQVGPPKSEYLVNWGAPQQTLTCYFHFSLCLSSRN